jgi:adenylate cyclase
MLFADVRGSTTLAERMNASEFSRLINRFFKAATDVLIQSYGIVDRMIGDEVFGIYIPGFAGPDHARLGVEAAQDILRVTGHENPEGPWIPVGAGVHTGVAYVGTVGSSEAVTDFTALGDAVNTAARLASQAAPGEVIISNATSEAAGLDSAAYEERFLALKGRAEPISTQVIHIVPS